MEHTLKRNISLDLLKLAMAFMVVGLHARFLSEISKFAEFLFVNGIFRIAVPIFFIINGFYFYSILIKKKELEWFKKVGILYLVWMTFYSYFWFNLPGMSTSEIFDLVAKFLIGYQHLWYVSGMIGAALIILLINKLNTSFIITSVLVTFLIGVFIQYAGNYHLFQGSDLDIAFNETWVHRNFLFFAFPFFTIGFLINKYSFYNVISKKVNLIGLLTGGAMLTLESSINYYQPFRDGAFDNYLSLIFLCPLIFIYFQKNYISGATKQISLYASGIYFIHSFILTMLKTFLEYKGVTLTILGIIISALASIFIIKINRRVKVIL